MAIAILFQRYLDREVIPHSVGEAKKTLLQMVEVCLCVHVCVFICLKLRGGGGHNGPMTSPPPPPPPPPSEQKKNGFMRLDIAAFGAPPDPDGRLPQTLVGGSP